MSRLVLRHAKSGRPVKLSPLQKEDLRLRVWDTEVSIGLRWFDSVRDNFRHMWE